MLFVSHPLPSSLLRSNISVPFHGPLYLIERGQRPVKQPAFLNLRDISNKGLVTSLENLMEDNPVGFPILIAKSATLPRHPTFRVYPQTSMSSDEHAE